MVQHYPERLRDPQFRQDQPKRVDYSQLWTPPDQRLIPLDSDAENDLIAVIRAIGAGNLVPRHCYRSGIETNEPPDRLLTEQGVKHLHLGRKSDALLFLVEYETFVLLLDIKSHKVFEQEPPGSLLVSLHHNSLRRADTLAAIEKVKVAAEKLAARAAIGAKAALGLLPRKRRD